MNKEKNIKKAFIWNMIGSTSYSAASFLYLLIVTRLCGVREAGFFSLSYATAQLILSIGRYGMRTYQATDLRHKYKFTEYGISRVITCAVMLLIGIVYSGLSFSKDAIITSIFVIFLKMIDAIEDVYHGNFQQKYHVELMGKMLATRNIYSACSFTIILFITRNLQFTCIFVSLTSLLLCLVINQYFTKKSLEPVQEEERPLSIRNVVELLKICTPLFIGTFLSLLLYNIPKYAMAAVMTDEYQTYYSILFMPSFVISLMCEFVFKPTITSIAQLWWENKVKQFVLYVVRIMAVILGCCGAVVVGGHLIGRTLLEIVYGVDLSLYKVHFVVLLIGGGIGAGVYMLYNILIAIRKGRCITVVYGITAVLTILPAKNMIIKWGIMGASLNYLYSCSLLFIMFVAIMIYVVLTKSRQSI